MLVIDCPKKVPTKLAITSLVQFISIVAVIVLAIITAQTFDVLGWGVDLRGGFDVFPTWMACVRLFLIISIGIFLASSFVSLYYLMKMRSYNTYFPWLSLISWILPIYFIALSINTRDYKFFFETDSFSGYPFSKKWAFYSWSNVNKLLYVLALVVALLSILGFIASGKETYNYRTIGTAFFYLEFANITTVIVFIYLVSRILFSQLNFSKSSSPLLILCTYLTISFLGYWLVVFPVNVKSFPSSPVQSFSIAFVHIINPIIFIAYSINSLQSNKFTTDVGFKTLFGEAMVIPSVIMFYTFLSCTLVPMSLYGAITNINPSMIWHTPSEPDGNIANICIILALIPAFMLILFAYYRINLKVRQVTVKASYY